MESKAEGFGIINAPLQIPKLPEGAIIEILSRLPVKSLLRFKCVSKSWCSLISSKYFIKTHLENSRKDKTFARHRIISTIRKPFWMLEHYSLPSLLCEQVTYSFHFDCTMDKPKGFHVVGSCNGLICILIDRKYFFLWNPSTRESKRLPDFRAGMKNITDGYISKYGFGFDESSDDYKVYAIFSGIRFNSMYQAIPKVYSLKADSWKRNELLEDDSPFDAEGKFACGKLHWNRKSELTSRWDIVSFDLKSEVFGIVEQPSYVEGDFYPTLGVLDGCLCVLCDYCKTRLDIWVWNQYGVKDSWVKMVTISYLSDPLEGPFSTPLCILPNGEVLFIHKSAFLSYNPKENWLWYPQIVGFVEFVGAEVYVESLVSLVDVEQVANDNLAVKDRSKKGKRVKPERGKSKRLLVVQYLVPCFLYLMVSKRGKPRTNGRTDENKSLNDMLYSLLVILSL